MKSPSSRAILNPTNDFFEILKTDMNMNFFSSNTWKKKIKTKTKTKKEKKKYKENQKASMYPL